MSKSGFLSLERVLAFICGIQSPWESEKELLTFIEDQMENQLGFDLARFYPYEKEIGFCLPIDLHRSAQEIENFFIWLNKFSVNDPFNPQNWDVKGADVAVALQKDIPTSSFQENYKNFRGPILDQATLKLAYEGNFLGCLTVARIQTQHPFSESFRSLFMIFAKCISSQLGAIRKREQLRLRVSEFSSLLEEDDDGVFLLDKGYNILYHNTKSMDYLHDMFGDYPFASCLLSILSPYPTRRNSQRLDLRGSIGKYQYHFLQMESSTLPFSAPTCTYMLRIKQTYVPLKVNSALAKEYRLTPREVEVLNLLLQGAGNDEIARELFITPNTVKKHISNLYQKLGASSRVELMNKLHDYRCGRES